MFYKGFIYLDVSANGQLDLQFQMCYRTIKVGMLCEPRKLIL